MPLPVGEHKDICCQRPGEAPHYYSREQARKARCCAACHDGESDRAFADVMAPSEED